MPFMVDLAQIVLSLLPATPGAKAPSPEVSTETAVPADFLSLLSGQLSASPNEPVVESPTTSKALMPGKKLPEEDESGNLIPVAAPTPVLVAAVWLTPVEQAQIPVVAPDETLEDSDS